jgi:hypothetical protein
MFATNTCPRFRKLAASTSPVTNVSRTSSWGTSPSSPPAVGRIVSRISDHVVDQPMAPS